MANEEHLYILQQGIKNWNNWRKKHREISPDLSEADLSNTEIWKADLRGVNFSKAKLCYADLNNSNLSYAQLWGADLRGAYLWKAELRGAYLGRADLREANLSGAILTKVQALASNFEKANLTGACIEEWNINSETIMDGVICDYVYLKEKPLERFPSTGNLAAGEFTKLFQKTQQIIDLVFIGGIDWRAFVVSFQKLQSETNLNEIFIQGIENKRDGALIIKLNIPGSVNKEEMENYFKREYDIALKLINEEYRIKLDAKEEQLAIYRQQSMDLIEITTILANTLSL
jgi:uncharacterized protein YjbI with pentapeptide repeats